MFDETAFFDIDAFLPAGISPYWFGHMFQINIFNAYARFTQRACSPNIWSAAKFVYIRIDKWNCKAFKPIFQTEMIKFQFLD